MSDYPYETFEKPLSYEEVEAAQDYIPTGLKFTNIIMFSDITNDDVFPSSHGSVTYMNGRVYCHGLYTPGGSDEIISKACDFSIKEFLKSSSVRRRFFEVLSAIYEARTWQLYYRGQNANS